MSYLNWRRLGHILVYAYGRAEVPSDESELLGRRLVARRHRCRYEAIDS